MFRIKICGITRAEDAQSVADAGADAVGLNFFPRSPRYLAPEQAKSLVSALPTGLLKVGLFVNASAEEVCRTFDDLRLNLVQLHGDEPPEFLSLLAGRPILRAFRVGPLGLQPVFAYLDRCQQLGTVPQMILIDAQVPGQYGGTGQTADWQSLQAYPAGGAPLVLAGGLTPANVAAAVRAVRPAAVDTASGVEVSPGVKDPALVRQFVEAARSAMASSP
jgi:phosphoribosylanthranilate isomerase